MIELKNIKVSFDDKIILKNIGANIDKGDFLIIKGASGRGKSSLLNIIGLLELPSEGEVLYDGKSIKKEKNRLIQRRDNIAFIYQNYGLLSNKNIYQNLILPLNVNKKDTNKLEDTLEKVGLEHLNLKTKVYQCSGGEQQRIAVARALLKDPKVLIADEPTGNLDQKNGELIIDLFKEMNRNGVTIIMATHEKSYFDIGNKLIDLDNESLT